MSDPPWMSEALALREADRFVDRIFHALEKDGIPAERVWEASRASDDGGAQIQVLCEDGMVVASTAPRSEHVIPLGVGKTREAVKQGVDAIREAIQRYGGLKMVSVPIEN